MKTTGEQVWDLRGLAEWLRKAGQVPLEVSGSFRSTASPPPFCAQFAEVEVDRDRGTITVTRLVSVVDAGVVINPSLAKIQIEGAVVQGLGMALHEEMRFDGNGAPINRTFDEYGVPRVDVVPAMKTFFVESMDPAGPFGAKSVAEIGIDAVAPAVANAVFMATGLRIRELPITAPKLRDLRR